jgi:hypothetical protein
MPQKPPVDYGTRLADAQKRLGWTNEETWDALDVSDTTWFLWKRTGKVPPHRVRLLQRVLGVEPLHPQPDTQREWALEEKVSVLEAEMAELREALSEVRRLQREDS